MGLKIYNYLTIFINFLSFQSEINELKQKLSDSTELKQKHDELVAKLNTIEQQNVKYKAKLKQLMGKQKAAEANSLLVMAEQRSTSSTPVNHSPTLHDPEKHFDTFSTQTELDNQSVGRALEENLNLKEKLSSLENQLKELYDKNLVLCEQINILNSLSMNTQSMDELKLIHENEIKELNRAYIEQIKQYEANFNSIQGENDQLLEQIDELKLKLDEAKANDEAKAKNEDLLNKISTLEQTNLKYKAKLKQLVGKQKGNEKTDTHLQTLEEQRSLTTTPTIHTEEKVECKLVSSSDELESLRTEFKAEKDRLENLLELKQTMIDRLNQEVDLMNDKIEAEKSNAKESEEKCLNEANKEIKDKQAQIDSLTHELSGLNAKLSVKVGELEENLSKISGLEQQNLKYKAKLKQLLGKQKETGAHKPDPHTTSGLLTIEEQRSLNTTPISHSPIYQEKHFETAFSQTDLSQQNIDNVFSQYNELMNSYSCFESKLNESRLELEGLKLVNQNLESLKSDYETQLTDLRNSNFELNAKLDDLNRLSQVEKVESSLVRAAPSNQENEEFNNAKTELNTLKERLETTQQQNLKYKAKLKQLMTSNKKTSKQLEDGGLLHLSSDVGMQTDLEDALDKNLVLSEAQQIESLTNELTNLKEINQKCINDLNELENKLNEAVNENNSLRNVCAEYEERLKNETERLESTIMSKQSMIDRLNEEINEINDRVQTEKSNYDLLTQTHLDNLSVKETLERELESTNSLIEEKQTLIEKLNAELNGLNERINMQKSEFESKLNELEHNYKIQIVNKDESINQLRQINEHNNDELKTHAEHKYTELKELIDLKQKMNESLINESNELKSIIESQRLNYEKQLSELMSIIKEKESKIIELNKSSFNFVEYSLKKEESNQTDEVQTELLTNDVDVVKTNLNLTNKCSHLEAQLKYCHEKCENVVLKLNQLKKQNESLNTKIKSIKSMIYI
jgi:chromosome segregation ATPase